MSNPDDPPPLTDRLATALTDTNSTLSIAESCTGGLISARLASQPGASEYLDRTVVTYGYDAHRHLLGVTRESLDSHGAVSRRVASEMAQRIRDTADTTWGLSATGIAGPTGGSDQKPVGTAIIGVAYAGQWGTNTSYTVTERYEFDGNRQQIMNQITETSLRRLLVELESQ